MFNNLYSYKAWNDCRRRTLEGYREFLKCTAINEKPMFRCKAESAAHHYKCCIVLCFCFSYHGTALVSQSTSQCCSFEPRH